MNESAFNAEYAEAQRTQRFSYGFLCAPQEIPLGGVSAISALEEVKGFDNV